jgi:hypothetical protein
MTTQTRNALIAIACAALLTACEKATETPPEVREDIAAAEMQTTVDVAMAKAEGEYQVAIERCDALTGTERDACVNEAIAALNAAKDAAQGFTAPPKSQ